MRNLTFLALAIALCEAGNASADPPTTTDPRLIVELVAREPEIMTPTGIAVDEKGQVWVIENNTHERPASYEGPSSDRILVFSDLDAMGHAGKVRVFAEGFRNSMGLALGAEGAVYLSTRSEIFILRDLSGNGRADDRRSIIRLDTPGKYPHNGLSGMAFDPTGNLFFALGENLGADYKLIGSDDRTLTGGGEGGNIYRCRPDGRDLTRVATGFWNTFAIQFDGLGRLFAVDNDPDSRGPCRLLHIITGGDYGYRFRNGRKGLHPFTSWNGELPGTLPMVAGTAEAPSGIIAYESNGLPAEYRGQLLTTSWGDHVIERFKLAAHGASFSSQAETLVRGGDDFRPVGIAVGPDGALYVSDWVDRSYPVHGKGRIWRIRSKDRSAGAAVLPSTVKDETTGELRSRMSDPRIEIRFAAGAALARRGGEGRQVLEDVLHNAPDIRPRLHALWAASNLSKREFNTFLAAALADPAPEIRAEVARLFAKLPPADRTNETDLQIMNLALSDINPTVRMECRLAFRSDPVPPEFVPCVADPDPFLASAAITAWTREFRLKLLFAAALNRDALVRVGILLALRRTEAPGAREALPRFLADPDPGVRRAAIQWVGEERIKALADRLPQAASIPPVTRELFEALIAAQDFLSGARHEARDESSGEQFLSRVLEDRQQPASFRAIALRMLPPNAPAVTVTRLREFLGSSDPELRQEAILTLMMRGDDAAQELLRTLAVDAKQTFGLRAAATAGLGLSATTSPTKRTLLTLLNDPTLARDAIRSLRPVAGQPEVTNALHEFWEARAKSELEPTSATRELCAQIARALATVPNARELAWLDAVRACAGPRPADAAQWQQLAAEGGAPYAGARLFFHSQGPRCFICHRIDGRGTAIGPDLSVIGRSTNRQKLAESILNPSKEVAPQFQSWIITTRNGLVRTGIIVDEGFDSTITIADAAGKLERINRLEVDERHAIPRSIMPDNLIDLMTPAEFRDLIAFLAARK